jgi:hypothetical protein
MARNVLVAPLLGTRAEEEWDRLERTIRECDAMRVVLLTLPREKDKFAGARDFARMKLAALTEKWPRFRWEERTVDLFDFDACLRAFAVLMNEESENDVTISLGTAGAVGASAAAVACMIWQAQGIYVGSPGYDTQPVSYLPTWLSAGAPVTADGLRVLKLLEANSGGMDKKTLVAELEKLGRIPTGLENHAYRRLSTGILPELVEHGFVTVGPRDDWDRRHHFVRLTVDGRRVLAILGPTVREPSATISARGKRKPTPT